MSKFDEIVKNIALENEKCNYNPEKDMNWCKLPPEMRSKCVKQMDFKTRCGFRGVSKTEKALVDSKKYKFKHLQINLDGYGNHKVEIIANSGNKESKIRIRTEERLNEKCLSAIFKHAEVKNFRLSILSIYESRVRRILEQLQKFAPFPFKRVSVFGNPCIDFFMQNCPNLEKVDVNGELPYEKMLNHRSLMKINEFEFRGVSSSDLLEFLPRLVQKWIDNDAEIGKSVQYLIGYPWIVQRETQRFFDTFTEKFADRIIEKTDKELRIRMNNEKTQILMKSMRSGQYNGGKCFFSCKVIPIDLPESEYGKGEE